MSILDLPIEIICQIMGYLGAKPDIAGEDNHNRHRLCLYNSGILPHGALKKKTLKEQSDLIAFLLSNSKLYKMGLSVYYSTLLRPVIFNPFSLSQIGPGVYLEGYVRQHHELPNDYHFLSPTHAYNAFQQFPDLIYSVKSVAISDYVDTVVETTARSSITNLSKEEEDSWINPFVSSLIRRLSYFSGIRDIYLEIGNRGESALLVDLLVHMPFPSCLSSLSIIIKPGIIEHEALSLLSNRCQRLLQSSVEPFSTTSCFKFTGLKYLKFSVLHKYLLSCPCSLKARYTKLRDTDSSLCYSSLDGFTYLIALLRCLIFARDQQQHPQKQHQHSLEQLVLENFCPSFIFTPEKFFRYFQNSVWQQRKFPQSDSLLRLVQRSNQLNMGLPNITMLSINTFVARKNLYLGPTGSHYYPYDSYPYSLPGVGSFSQQSNGAINLSELASFVNDCPHNDNDWIYYYLILQEKYHFNARIMKRKQSMISFQNAIILDSINSAALNSENYTPEDKENNNKSSSVFKKIADYKINLKYLIEYSDWLEVCDRFNLIVN